MSTTSYTLTDFGPSDLLTNDRIGSRRVKSASEDSRFAAAYNGLLFSICAEHDIDAGDSIAVNLNFASGVIIHSISTYSDLEISVRDEFGTGTANGIFPAKNMNVCSVDETPANAQSFYAATANGNELAFGLGSVNPYIYACDGSTVSAVVANNGTTTRTIKVLVTFEELGPRNPVFGLTATTQLDANTEMSIYG